MTQGKSIIAIVLRIAASLCFMLAAGLVTKHVDWRGASFYRVVNFIGGGYYFFIALLPKKSRLWKTIVVIDVGVCILMSSSLGVGWQTYKGIVYGDFLVANTTNFCRKLLISFIFSSIGFVISSGFLAYCLGVAVDPLLCQELN